MTSGHREFRQNPDDRIVFLRLKETIQYYTWKTVSSLYWLMSLLPAS